MAASGPPKPGEPDCMSVCEMNDPITTGAPGRTSWARQMPASCSAICCESAAGIETGPIAPMRMNGVTTTIWSRRREQHQRADHALVEAQRRVGVGDAEHVRLALQRLAAERDLGHGDRVAARRPG